MTKSKTFRGRKIFHVEEMSTKCSICGKPFLKYFFDEDKQTGQSETMWGLEGDQKHAECIEASTGRPPLGLSDYNEIRRLNITKDEYYKRMGYE